MVIIMVHRNYYFNGGNVFLAFEFTVFYISY